MEVLTDIKNHICTYIHKKNILVLCFQKYIHKVQNKQSQ